MSTHTAIELKDYRSRFVCLCRCADMIADDYDASLELIKQICKTKTDKTVSDYERNQMCNKIENEFHILVKIFHEDVTKWYPKGTNSLCKENLLETMNLIPQMQPIVKKCLLYRKARPIAKRKCADMSLKKERPKRSNAAKTNGFYKNQDNDDESNDVVDEDDDLCSNWSEKEDYDDDVDDEEASFVVKEFHRTRSLGTRTVKTSDEKSVFGVLFDVKFRQSDQKCARRYLFKLHSDGHATLLDQNDDFDANQQIVSFRTKSGYLFNLHTLPPRPISNFSVPDVETVDVDANAPLEELTQMLDSAMNTPVEDLSDAHNEDDVDHLYRELTALYEAKNCDQTCLTIIDEDEESRSAQDTHFTMDEVLDTYEAINEEVFSELLCTNEDEVIEYACEDLEDDNAEAEEASAKAEWLKQIEEELVQFVVLRCSLKMNKERMKMHNLVLFRDGIIGISTPEEMKRVTEDNVVVGFMRMSDASCVTVREYAIQSLDADKASKSSKSRGKASMTLDKEVKVMARKRLPNKGEDGAESENRRQCASLIEMSHLEEAHPLFFRKFKLDVRPPRKNSVAVYPSNRVKKSSKLHAVQEMDQKATTCTHNVRSLDLTHQGGYAHVQVAWLFANWFSTVVDEYTIHRSLTVREFSYILMPTVITAVHVNKAIKVVKEDGEYNMYIDGVKQDVDWMGYGNLHEYEGKIVGPSSFKIESFGDGFGHRVIICDQRYSSKTFMVLNPYKKTRPTWEEAQKILESIVKPIELTESS